MPGCKICNQEYYRNLENTAQECDCDMEKLDGCDMLKKARTIHNKRISHCVRTYYNDIVKAVEKGRFKITLLFDSDDDEDRTSLLTTIIDRLKKRFTYVRFMPDDDSKKLVVDWSLADKDERRSKLKRELLGSQASDTEVSDASLEDDSVQVSNKDDYADCIVEKVDVPFDTITSLKLTPGEAYFKGFYKRTGASSRLGKKAFLGLSDK